ncbi:MAG: hypothetical protein Q9161_009673 [Pseudevernia consocians]
MNPFRPTQKFTTQEAQDIENDVARRRMTSPTARTADNGAHSPDFLKIVPCNNKAKLAFSALIAKKGSPEMSEHHAQYLVSVGIGPLEKTQALQNVSSDETTDLDKDGADSNQQINLGHFRINFDCPGLTGGAKWSMGRGSRQRKGKQTAHRNVDILLAASKFGRSQQLLATHAYLKLHFESGVWMILAATGSDEVAASKGDAMVASPEATVLVDDEKLLGEQFWCLTKSHTRLQVQGMEYSVQFTISNFEETQSYRKARDKALRDQDIEPPRTWISGIPLASDIRANGLAVFSLGLASGASGCVYEGVDPNSGDLRAVKVVDIKKETAQETLWPEIIMNQRFGNNPGLVRQYGWQNSNGDKTLKVAHFPVRVYLVLEKGLGFHTHDWNRQEWATVDTRLRLCRDLLTGLATIHAQGWMHRDITKQNILLFEARPERPQPPRAALCDFGKLCFHKTDTVTTLAAWEYLPPELVPDQFNEYNQSIDIWMLALALVLVWYPRTEQNASRGPKNQLRTNGVEQLRTQLLKIKDSGLPILLRFMLSVNPLNRPSASEALQSPCFRSLDVEPAKMAKISSGGTPHLEEEDQRALHTHESQEL